MADVMCIDSPDFQKLLSGGGWGGGAECVRLGVGWGWGVGVVRETVFVCMHVFVCRLASSRMFLCVGWPLLTCFCV